MKAAGFAGMCVARCQLGLGPCFHPFPPGASVRHPQAGALKTVSMCSCLHLGSWPRVGTGPLPRPKLPSGSSASPRPRPDGCSTLLGPTPPPPVPDPRQETAWCRCRQDETTLCPRFRLYTEPPPPPRGLAAQGMFLKMNLRTSQQILHSKKPRP